MHSHPYHSRSISSQKITTVWHTKEITLVGFTLFFTGELGTGYIFINDLLNKTREIFNVCISLYIENYACTTVPMNIAVILILTSK